MKFDLHFSTEASERRIWAWVFATPTIVLLVTLLLAVFIVIRGSWGAAVVFAIFGFVTYVMNLRLRVKKAIPILAVRFPAKYDKGGSFWK